MYLNYTVPDDEIDKASKPSNESFVQTNETDQDELRHLQTIPASFDWRQRGAVGVVKHQGSCGVCYAFAVTGNIEGLYAIKYGQLLNFSEQQILDCDFYNYGCGGGIIAKTYDYLMTSGGLGLQSSLRYTQRKGACYAIRGVARVIGKQFAGSQNGYTIAAFLVRNGPLAAGVNASMFKYYRGGVMSYSTYQCAYTINHAITIVGYGKTNTGVNYWIVKNSWGPYWGERGYVRIAWGTCAINKYVLTGIIA
jgi:cathepsin F